MWPHANLKLTTSRQSLALQGCEQMFLHLWPHASSFSQGLVHLMFALYICELYCQHSTSIICLHWGISTDTFSMQFPWFFYFPHWKHLFGQAWPQGCYLMQGLLHFSFAWPVLSSKVFFTGWQTLSHWCPQSIVIPQTRAHPPSETFEKSAGLRIFAITSWFGHLRLRDVSMNLFSFRWSMTSFHNFTFDPIKHYEFPNINRPCLALESATQILLLIFRKPS